VLFVLAAAYFVWARRKWSGREQVVHSRPPVVEPAKETSTD